MQEKRHTPYWLLPKEEQRRITAARRANADPRNRREPCFASSVR